MEDLLSWRAVINAVTVGALYALIAVGYTMVYGIIKLINFAHGEVFMIGTYIGLLAFVQLGMPLVAAALLAMALCAILGVVIDFGAYLPLRRKHPLADWASVILLTLFGLLAVVFFELRRRGGGAGAETAVGAALVAIPAVLFLLAMLGLLGKLGRPRANVTSDRLSALITAIGMSLSLQTIAQLVWTADYRSFPTASLPAWLDADVIAWLPAGLSARLSEAGAVLQGKELLIWVAAFVLMVGLGVLVGFTRIGKAMRACALDKETAALMGINVNSVIGVTFAVGSALAAIAGILFAIKVGGNISPRMGYYPGVIAFAAAVLGGIGSIRGAVVGGLLIGFAQTLGPEIWQEVAEWATGGDHAAPTAYDFAFAFGIMILVILFRPWGLFGKAEAKRA